NADAMDEALDDAARAVRGLGAALLAGAQDALDQAEDALTEASHDMRDSMAESMTVMALSSAGELDATSAWLKQEKIVSADGVDFDKALAAIEASDMDPAEKAELTKALGSVRAGIAEARAGLLAFEATLESAQEAPQSMAPQEIKQ
ncbi:MAG: hypothetical protein OIF40_08075, partial [Mangrovicoccus sp.]|nr:hypothetical protein [Mangrovicoccus sp.]